MYAAYTKPNFIVIIRGVEKNVLIISCFEVTDSTEGRQVISQKNIVQYSPFLYLSYLFFSKFSYIGQDLQICVPCLLAAVKK